MQRKEKESANSLFGTVEIVLNEEKKNKQTKNISTYINTQTQTL